MASTNFDDFDWGSDPVPPAPQPKQADHSYQASTPVAHSASVGTARPNVNEAIPQHSTPYTPAPVAPIKSNAMAASANLDTLEFEVNKLFNMHPQPPSSLLDSKFNELASAVCRIPDDSPDMILEWHRRMRILKERITKESAGPKETIQQPPTPTPVAQPAFVASAPMPSGDNFDWGADPVSSVQQTKQVEPPAQQPKQADYLYYASTPVTHSASVGTARPSANETISQRPPPSTPSTPAPVQPAFVASAPMPSDDNFDWGADPVPAAQQQTNVSHYASTPLAHSTSFGNAAEVSNADWSTTVEPPSTPQNANLSYTASTNDNEHIIQELTLLESLIANMLSKSPRPEAQVEKKMMELEEFIGKIPPRCTELLAQWNAKKQAFLYKLNNVGGSGVERTGVSVKQERAMPAQSAYNYDSNAPFDYTAEPVYDAFVPPGEHPYNEPKVQENEYQNSGNVNQPSGDNYQDYNTGNDSSQNYTESNRQDGNRGHNDGHPRHDNRPEDNPEMQALKEEITTKLEAAFGKFNVITEENDLRGLKFLYLLVLKARRLIEVFKGNRNQMFADSFSWALSKLPADLQGQCDQEQKSLNTMSQFLSQKVKEISEAKAQEPGDEFAQLFHCSFCKINGHNNMKCPIIGSMLCHQCLRFGHLKRRCINDILEPEQFKF